MLSVTNVEDASRSTRLLSQTTLRNILGTKTLAEVLSEREAVSHMMQVTIVSDNYDNNAARRGLQEKTAPD